jgi:hypothetical protein
VALAQIKQEQQLYYLFKKLGDVVEDRDELGMLIGYSIVSSLLGLTSNTPLRRERRAEALVAVHEGLEKTLQDCTAAGSYPTLLSLQSLIETYSNLESPETSGAEQKKRKVPRIKKTLLKNPGSFYCDQLRKKGLRILSQTSARGAYESRSDILNKDYNILESCFAEKGGLV